MKLSIIVPIYNVEQYLRKCVDSLLAQDLAQEEYEVILVDDGSTDQSGQIADEYAGKWQNVKVFHQLNGGLSAARNAGIDIANGKYVMFVDSDDYIEPNMLNTIVSRMDRDNLDVLRFRYRNVNEQYEEIYPNKYDNIFDDYSETICDGQTFLNERLGSGCYACQFALKRELTRIRFIRGRYFEDTDWTPRMLLQTHRVSSIDLTLYNYLHRIGSITQSINDAKKRKVITDKIWLITSLWDTQKFVSNKLWFEGMIANTVISILTSVALNFYGERQRYISELKNLKVFPIANHHLTPAAQRKRKIINLSPNLFCIMVHIKNK